MQKKSGRFLTLLLLMGSLASAEGTGWGSKGDRDDMHKQMKSELGLTKEQEKKLDTHRIEHRAEMEKLMLVIKEKREELKTALEDPKMNHHAVERINSDLKDAHNDMADKRLEGILYVREVLTPEQFKKFLSLRPGKDGKEGKRGGRGKKKETRDGSKDGHQHGHRDAMDDDPMDMPKPH